MIPALIGAVAVTPVYLGALATVVVAKSVAFFKQRRYKLSYNLIKLLRGDSKNIKYFKFFTKGKEKHWVSMERDEFLASDDYSKILKSSQIAPVVEDRFKEIYGYSQEYPVLDTETTENNSHEYKPEFVRVEPKSDEEFEAETKKRVRKEKINAVLKTAILVGIQTGLSKAVAERTK